MALVKWYFTLYGLKSSSSSPESPFMLDFSMELLNISANFNNGSSRMVLSLLKNTNRLFPGIENSDIELKIKNFCWFVYHNTLKNG